MANELIVTNAAALAALVDKITGDTLTATEYTTLKDSVQEANTATRTANTVFSGPTTGAAAAPTFRALVAADIPTGVPLANLAALTIDRALVSSGAGVVSASAVTATELGYVSGVTSAIQTQLNAKQASDATLTALAALDATTGFVQQTAADTFVKADLTAGQINTALTYTAADAANLNATNLTSGTIPDARFPATLPAISGANLTNLPGGISGLTTNVIPQAGSATTIIDSKMTASGGSFGTWTLYDNGGTGNSSLIVRGGASQTLALFNGLDNAGTSRFGFNLGNYTLYVGGILSVRIIGDGARALVFPGEGSPANIYGDGFAEITATNLKLQYPNSTPNVGLAYSAAGILAVTNGSTGFGAVRASALGTQTANGAICNVKSISESITLDTGALFTDSAADLLPANSVIRSVVARITTTITTSTDWALGDPTSPARFASANATLAAGTTTVGLNHRQGSVATDALGPVQTAAAKLRITLTGANPGAGVVRVTVFYEEFTAPTS